MSDCGTIEVEKGSGGTLGVRLSGPFCLSGGVPDISTVEPSISSEVKKVVIKDTGIEAWDSALVTFLMGLRVVCQQRAVELDINDMPQGVQRLFDLASAVDEREGAARKSSKKPLVERIGVAFMALTDGVSDSVSFIGQVTISFARLLVGKARYRRADLWLTIQECGPAALGIVTVITVLVGAILAFVGAIQLKMFGAEVYVANLVGLGMVIEMGALMTGIILSGRTGAAFAAQIGTMQVNEEIDALKTMGIPPIDYLVLPRMLALVLMTPLLVIYADILGILGGATVGIFLLDIPPRLFFEQTFSMMTLWQCMQGLIKGSSFGLLIAIAGCMRGMQCGRSAASVGEAATSAVVTSIVAIVVVDAIWTFIFMVVG